jgi:hypothetical protein
MGPVERFDSATRGSEHVKDLAGIVRTISFGGFTVSEVLRARATSIPDHTHSLGHICWVVDGSFIELVGRDDLAPFFGPVHLRVAPSS